ncbi:MAG TPA: hypothetical protein VHW65_13020, partial [Gemmatimonadales bacterium]|nr:hypothetical protein [Gemmatimonadales bacterium]
DTLLLEERTVHALRAQGLLVSPRRRVSPALIGSALAAALVVFVAGTAFGRELAQHQIATAPPEVQVQRAGSEYVAAITRLAGADAAESPHRLVAGLEAGTATLRAAAVSLSQIAPADTTVRRIRASLDAATNVASTQSSTVDGRPVIWF